MGRKIKINFPLVILIAIGSLSWILTMVKSGLVYDYGMGFWGPNGHDGVWHIALANSLARGSLEMPVFAGFPLQNYHIGFDLILAILHKITFISTTTLYFQIIPIILAVSIGVLTYIFVINWQKSKGKALWAVFFVYFAGGWGWLVTLMRGQGLGGESMFWSQQAVSTLINPPFALSLVFLLLGLICLQRNKKILAIICFGLLISIKAYAGVLVLGGLLVILIYQLIFHRAKALQIGQIFIGSLILSLLLFLPLNNSSSGLLVWQPFWFLETMMGLSDRFSWPKYYEAMVNYKAANPIKFVLAYGLAFALFWFGNLGTRFIKEIKVITWIRNVNKLDNFEVFFASVITAGVIIPMFFLQSGTPWNTIQFLYYSLFLSSILAGIALPEFLQKIKSTNLQKFTAAGFIILTIPTTLITLFYNYLPSRPPAKISISELEALTFLSNQPNGVVLTYPFDRAKADEAIQNPPRPLYLYESTSYVSAFADKPVFLEDEVNLTIMNYPWPERRLSIEQFYKSLDQDFVRSFLGENNINYIYWVKPQRATLGETQLGIEKIFENTEVDIYKVN